MDFEGTRPYRFVLLTGAGFSYSFGGFLAHEFRLKIFNRRQVQDRQRVKDLLTKEPSFEVALATVRAGAPYDSNDVEALESAVFEAFHDMDRDIGGLNHYRGAPLDVYAFQRFVSRFQCPRNQQDRNAGFVFTLNQDLCLERKWYNQSHHGYTVTIPGPSVNLKMNQEGRHFFGTNIGDYRDAFETTIPTAPSLELVGYTNYIKLHGSMNWRSDDGRQAMVIGTGKTEQIDRSPLLKAYRELFEYVLSQPKLRIMVVGYGFQDDHINETLAKAAGCGSEFWVWNPAFWELQGAFQKIGINVIGGTTASMSDLFPQNASHEPTDWQNIREKFFEEVWSH